MTATASGWTWREGQVDPNGEHFQIHYFEDADEKSTTDWGDPAARVGRSGEAASIEFLVADELIRNLVRSDLDTFLLEDYGLEPWAYLKAWTGRFGNAYSQTHWSYTPSVGEAEPAPAADEEVPCWEKTDHVPGDEAMTAFRRAARKHQCEWRESKGLKPGATRGAEPRLVGSWLDLAEAEDSYSNFLSDNAARAARDRIDNPQKHEAPLKNRLLSNLLASMPMCFNLFGELWANHELATRALKTWLPDLMGEVEDVRFEWSPGRADPAYLNNRTAFDVAFVLALPDGTRGIVGIETKYHEFAIKEAIPPGNKLLRYAEVTERSQVFKKEWPRHVLGSTLQQLWLDHLLALSMTQHREGTWSWAKSLVVFPARNLSLIAASGTYKRMLEDQSAFESRTLEELLDAQMLPQALERDFRERYLW